MKNFLTDRERFIPAFFTFCLGMFISQLITNAAPQSANTEDEYLLAYKGQDKLLEQFPEDIARQLNSLDKDFRNQKRRLLESAALRFYLYDYAQKQELSLELAAEALFPPSSIEEHAIADYYANNQERLGKPYFEVKPAIRALLLQKSVNDAKEAALRKLEKQGDLVLYVD